MSVQWAETEWSLDGIEDQPGTVSAQQQRAIHAAYDGKMSREARLKHLSAMVGREVTSTNDLSFAEGRRARDKLKGARI